MRYELITSGDELLLGLTVNGHLAFIGGQLGRRGAALHRNLTITDEFADIVASLRDSWNSADVVLVTGGLGPTCDDRTREAAAAVLGQELVFDAAIEKSIADRFALHGRAMTANNRRQAYRFRDGEVLSNANGTAPGLWFERDGRIMCLLPGPPNELEPMFFEQVIPRLVARRLLPDREAYIQVRTAGVGESLLETRLQPLFATHGEALCVAFCAHQGQVDFRLSSRSAALSYGDLERIAGDCSRLLGEDFICCGHDSLARVCADLLRAQDKRLAVAETATGGLLAHAFSDVAGACKFFAGGVVCASNDAKMQLLDVPECLLLQHGAASDENAVAMATGAAEKLGADYALAITGFAGPTGGAGQNPVGTIHIALFSPAGIWSKKQSYPGPRGSVKARAVSTALDWLRRELLRAPSASPAPRAARVMQ